MTPSARIGLIIPSVNRRTEPEFNRLAPADVAVHVARVRLRGPDRRPLAELEDAILDSAGMLVEAKADIIGFHCTAAAMEGGVDREKALIERVAAAAGRPVVSTGQVVVAAFDTLGVRRICLVSPYERPVHDAEIAYLRSAGFGIVADRALELPGDEYDRIAPERWTEIAREVVPPDADGCLLSCTNTTMTEAVESCEEALGRPVVATNQAMLWACLHALRSLRGGAAAIDGPGSLFGRAPQPVSAGSAA